MGSIYKKFHPYTLLFTAAICLGSLTACSSSEGDEENLEANKNGNQGDLGGDDAAEGNGQENFVDSGESKGGAEVNSDTSASATDPGASADSGSNPLALGNASSPGGNATAPVANAAPSNGNSTKNSAGGDSSAPANDASQGTPAVNDNDTKQAKAGGATTKTPAPVAASSSNDPMAPRPNGRVRYVKEGGVQVVNAPNGSPVMTLEQGDHPVTWEENGWLKLADGLFVPVDGLSSKGVGRAKGGQSWSH